MGATKATAVRKAKYRNVPVDKHCCIVQVEGPRIGKRWEAHFPCNTEKRAKNAAVRYETFKKKRTKTGITTLCVHEGNLRKNICRVYRQYNLQHTDWYQENCK